MVPRSHRAGGDAEAFGNLLDAHRIEARHGPDGSACRGARTKGHVLNLAQIRHSRLHSRASVDYNERMAQTTRPDSREAHLRWIGKAENWGEWLRFSETDLAEPESMWMLSGPGGVRFYAVGKGQVGKQHKSVLAAACWAWANRWCWTEPDTGSVNMATQLACREWVLKGGAEADRHDPTYVKVDQ
jgi:hypothetical protein